jgi:hypothetical protein
MSIYEGKFGKEKIRLERGIGRLIAYASRFSSTLCVSVPSALRTGPSSYLAANKVSAVVKAALLDSCKFEDKFEGSRRAVRQSHF